MVRTEAMARTRWDHANEHDLAVLVAFAEGPHRRALKTLLAQVAGRDRARTLGHYPRFKVILAGTGADALRRSSGARAAVVDLSIPGGPGLELIRGLRATRPSVAILAVGSTGDASDAVAAVMSGADFFHELQGDGTAAAAGVEQALELAIDRRRLTHEIERTEAEMEAARGKLAQLSGELVRAVPGFQPLQTREDVLPFREAARRYLLAAAQLFGGDPRGLSRALGVSYFALRRLLARYDVPFPAARPRR